MILNKWIRIQSLPPDGKEEFSCKSKNVSPDNNVSWFKRFQIQLFKVQKLSNGIKNRLITKLCLILEWVSLFQSQLNSKWDSKWQVNNGYLRKQRTKKIVSKVDLTCLVSVKLLISSFLTMKSHKLESASYIWFMKTKPLVISGSELLTSSLHVQNGLTTN